jgi:phosphinothricin acetyltransferase
MSAINMNIRPAQPSDAAAVAAIYAPIVRDTFISFEQDPPSAEQMQARIVAVTATLPWLVSVDDSGLVTGYVYAGRHRERAAYRWSVDTTAYVGERHRGQGIGRRLYTALFGELTALGYFQAFAGIALPNVASVGLHEALGFTPIGVYRDVGYKCGAWRDVGWWQKTLQSPPSPSVLPPEPLAFAGGRAA